MNVFIFLCFIYEIRKKLYRENLFCDKYLGYFNIQNFIGYRELIKEIDGKDYQRYC